MLGARCAARSTASGPLTIPGARGRRAVITSSKDSILVCGDCKKEMSTKTINSLVRVSDEIVIRTDVCGDKWCKGITVTYFYYNEEELNDQDR
jgi:hypothetical protein